MLFRGLDNTTKLSNQTRRRELEDGRPSALPATFQRHRALISGIVRVYDPCISRANLGCEFISFDQYAMVMSVGGHKIRIAKVPNFTPLQGTILGWEVENIEAVVAWLKDKGVILKKYPFVQDRELGIWTALTGDKVASFKDPDGNILSVSQHHLT